MHRSGRGQTRSGVRLTWVCMNQERMEIPWCWNCGLLGESRSGAGDHRCRWGCVDNGGGLVLPASCLYRHRHRHRHICTRTATRTHRHSCQSSIVTAELEQNRTEHNQFSETPNNGHRRRNQSLPPTNAATASLRQGKSVQLPSPENEVILKSRQSDL